MTAGRLHTTYPQAQQVEIPIAHTVEVPMYVWWEGQALGFWERKRGPWGPRATASMLVADPKETICARPTSNQ
jgi:hypothetical protein